MKFILVATLIMALPTLLSAKEIKVEYKDLSYTVKQDSKKFVYENKFFKKEYLVKKCNEEHFKLFWTKYKINKSNISRIAPVSQDDYVKLKEDKKSIKVNPNVKFGLFLKSVPTEISALDMNEKIRCLK